MERLYRVGEVAEMMQMSIRTLHHYDQIGLLRPSAHSEGGYRLYAERDLVRLQQILTLRYLGFPLKQIREIFGRPDLNLVASLRVQRRALGDRVAELQRIQASLDTLIDRRLTTGEWAWDLVAQASATVQTSLTEREETLSAYYTPDQMKQFEELRPEVPAEEIRAIEEGWTALLAKVRANRDLDPASPAAQVLADRWNELTERMARYYRNRPELWQAIGENYQQGRFEGHDRAPQAADFAFIQRVNEARRE